MHNLNIGLCITGSYCNFERVFDIIKELKNNNCNIIPIISESVKLNTRFFKGDDFIKKVKEETGNNIIDTIAKAEPVGPKNICDLILICPCTGNTLAKLNNGITDTPVTMACKSHLRGNKPIVIGISTNDALGYNFKNIGELLNKKHVYFIPFFQDDYINKPKSLVFSYDKVFKTIEEALNQKQIQPIIHIQDINRE